MSTTGYKINGTDLADLTETTRDSSTDPSSPFSNSGFNNSTSGSLDTSLSRIPSHGFYGTGISLSGKFDSNNVSNLTLMEKGCRPRFTHTILKQTYYGTSSRKHYFALRRNNEIHIFSSYDLNAGYSRIAVFNSSTVRKYGPKFLYVELVGGGGGGSWWPYRGHGVGGAGGGVLYQVIYIRESDSAISSNENPTSDDCICSIHQGGHYGYESNVFVSTRNGQDGTDSYIIKNGTVISVAGGGKGGKYYNKLRGKEPGNAAGGKCLGGFIKGVTGGQGTYDGGHNAYGGNCSIDTYINNEHLSWWSSNGGDQGGGASRANGGESEQTGGTPGGGGGGGGNDERDYIGGSGGPGGVTFFY